MADDFSLLTKIMLENRKQRQQEIDVQKKSLDTFKEKLEESGVKAEDSAKYQKLSYELQKKELAQRFKDARGNPSARREIRNERRELDKKQGSLLTKISIGVTGMFKSMRQQLAKRAGRTLMQMVKGTLFAGLLVAVLAFLNSPLWEKTKEKLADIIMNLQSRFDFDKLADKIEQWTGIDISSWDAFTTSFDKQMDDVGKRLNQLKWVAMGIGAALLIGPLFGIPVLLGAAAVGTLIAAWMHRDDIAGGLDKLQEAFKQIGIELTPFETQVLAVVSVVASAAFILKKIAGAARKVLGLPARALGITAATRTAAQAAGAATAADPTKALKKGMIMQGAGGKKVIWQGGSFAEYKGDKKRGKMDTGALKKPGMIGSQVKTESVMGKVPAKTMGKVGQLLHFLNKIPYLKTGIMAATIIASLSKHGPTPAAIPMIAELLTGIGGGALGAMLGGMAGLAGGPLSAFTAVAGGLAGYFTGATLGKAVGQWLIDEPIDAFNVPMLGDVFGINEMLNKRLYGIEGSGTSMPMGGMFTGGTNVAQHMSGAAAVGNPRVVAGNVSALRTNQSLEGTGLEDQTGRYLPRYDTTNRAINPVVAFPDLVEKYAGAKGYFSAEMLGRKKHDAFPGFDMNIPKAIKVNGAEAIPTFDVGANQLDLASDMVGVARFLEEVALKGMENEFGNGTNVVSSNVITDSSNTTTVTGRVSLVNENPVLFANNSAR